MIRRRALAAAGAALVVVVAVTGGFLLAREKTVRTDRIDPQAAYARAVDACRSVDEVYRLVEEDAPAPDVFDAAEAAQRAGSDARNLDPMWTILAGGADALRLGLRDDDARATQLGRQILDVECRRVRTT